MATKQFVQPVREDLMKHTDEGRKQEKKVWRLSPTTEPLILFWTGGLLYIVLHGKIICLLELQLSFWS